MKKEITLGQLLSVGVTIIIALATGWITLSNKVAKLEQEDIQIKSEQFNMQLKLDRQLDKIESKMDLHNQEIKNILIELQNKQNRRQ